jgi:hypothetical protein
MAKFEYRFERLAQASRSEPAAALNHWGDQGWQAFQIENTGDLFQVWLRREIPAVLAGLRSSGPRRPATASCVDSRSRRTVEQRRATCRSNAHAKSPAGSRRVRASPGGPGGGQRRILSDLYWRLEEDSANA